MDIKKSIEVRAYFILFCLIIIYNSGVLIAQDQLGLESEITSDKTDSLHSGQRDTLSYLYRPFQIHNAVDDSLLRWIKAGDVYELAPYFLPVNNYHQSGYGRENLMIINGFNSQAIPYFLNGRLYRNLLNGQTSLKMMPFLQIREMRIDENKIDVHLSRYNVLKPLSIINVDQTEFGYTSILGVLTNNYDQKTNYEVAFWNRAYDAAYVRNKYAGIQFQSALNYRHDNDRLTEVRFLYDSHQQDESDGYFVDAITNYTFNRFTTTALNKQSESSVRNRSIRLDHYIRKDSSDEYQLGIEHRQYRRSLKGKIDSLTTSNGQIFSRIDTSFTKVTSTSLLGRWRTQRDLLNFDLRFQTAYNFKNRDTKPLLNHDSWVTTEAFFDASYNLNTIMDINVETNLHLLNDHFGYLLQPTLKLQFNEALRLDVGYQINNMLNHYSILGYNSEYNNLSSNTWTNHIAEVSAYFTTSHTKSTIELRYWVMGSTLAINQSSFFNVDQSGKWALDLWHRANLTHFEWKFSSSTEWQPTQELLLNHRSAEIRQQNRLSVYYKNYLFDRAAFVKFGVHGLLSPFNYNGYRYSADLDAWMESFQQPWSVPYFYRVDAELSARVRNMILYIKGQNLTQGYTMYGYMDSYGQPLPEYRIRYGLKVIFRN